MKRTGTCGRVFGAMAALSWLAGGGAFGADVGAAPAEVFRIYADAQGASHIERTHWLPVPHAAFGDPTALRQFFKSNAVRVSIVGGAPNFHAPAHNTAGHHSVVFMLSGSSTARTSDGATQSFKAGDIILLDDDHGPGASLVFGPLGYTGLVVSLS